MAYELKAKLTLIDKLSEPLRRATASIEKTKKATNEAAKSLDAADRAAKTAAASVGSMGGKLEATRRAVRTFRDENGRLRNEFGRFVKDVDRAKFSLDNFRKAASKGVDSAIDKARGFVGGAVKGGITAAGVGIAGAAATGAVLTKNALEISNNAEQAQIAFTTMLGSAEKAQSFIAEMNDFAIKTPFDVQGVQDAAKKMLAFGFDVKEVIPDLTAVGDAAAGLGLGAEGIDRITLALGQMRAKSKVSADEMLQLTEAGIPAWDILAKKMGITTQQVMKLSEKGLIPADKAINALVEGMEKRFPHMMDQQAKSLSGLWSQIKETFNVKILKSWGDGIAAAIKPKLDALVRWIDANGTTIDRWGQNLQQAATTAINWIISQFNRGFTYIKTHFLNNPEFQSLPDGLRKFEFVIHDLEKTFDSWYAAGGKTQIENTVNKLITYVDKAVQAASPGITSIGKDIGMSMAQGMLEGLKQFAKDNPELSALLTFISTPGPKEVKLAAALAVASGGVGVTEDVLKSANQLGNDVSADAKKFSEGGFWAGVQGLIDRAVNNIRDAAGVQRDENGRVLVGRELIEYQKKQAQSDGSHKSGLSRVPYDNYRANLHRDEAVLTASEAEKWRENKSGVGSVMVTGNTFIVRQESDIDAIADALARKLNALTGGVAAYGG